ncbi:MAG: N-6 DNA methylase, partial [Candidatus Bathyarchaeia archaeon]
MISTLVTNRTSFKTTYEAQIPYATKRIRGQYDTPSPVVELVTRLAVKDHLSKVLDPACGTGNFLLKSLEVMSELQAKYGKPSMNMRNQVYGVEIDPIS